MNQEAKILVGVGLATIAIVIGAIFFLGSSSQQPANFSSSNQQVADAKLLVKSDSNKITAPNAKVTIVEFADFQCPACGAAHPIVKQILAERQGKVNFVYRHFPLPQHKNAFSAAEAAEAAGEQGKFWQMYDKLYKNQNTWSESDNAIDIFTGYAKDLGLDLDKFKKSIEANKYYSKIRSDQNDGSTLGVNSTPTFFINGQKTVGVPNISDFKSKIDSELNKK